MPWTEVSIVDAREEFCMLAGGWERANIRELCRRFGISPTTGYLWLRRYQQEGRVGLGDRSRRPQSSPGKTSCQVEAAVINLRRRHPAWGGRKLRAVLLARGVPSPSASTITRILGQAGLLDPEDTTHRPVIRFEAPFPNDLWQMDYKGHFPLTRSGRCHPLTVLDDHARFALGLVALPNERGVTVQAELIRLFRRYGLPNRILCDNGPPWGCNRRSSVSALAVWLLRLDVLTIHGRFLHPQTQGKDQRFHRSLEEEVLSARSFDTLPQVQSAFDDWRYIYNHVRPHEALDLRPPITRYQPSPRPYPEELLPIEYPQTDLVRRVTTRGFIKLRGKQYYLGEGFCGYPVALRPSEEDGIHNVFFRHYAVATIDLREPVNL